MLLGKKATLIHTNLISNTISLILENETITKSDSAATVGKQL